MTIDRTIINEAFELVISQLDVAEDAQAYEIETMELAGDYDR